MKRLLATTMLVGFTASSAMAADVTISGSFELGYVNSSQNDAYTDTSASNPTGASATVASTPLRDFVPAEVKNGTQMYVQSDVNITFESTTDSGLTMKMNYGLDENGSSDTANTDDINFSLSGDFGEIYVTGKSDDSAARRLDIEAAYTPDEASTAHTIEDTGGYTGSAGQVAGGAVTAGTIVSYFIPTDLLSGLKAGVSFANAGTASKGNMTEWAVQYAGEMSGASYVVHYGYGSYDGNGSLPTDTVLYSRAGRGGKATGYGAEISFGSFTVGSESSVLDIDNSQQEFQMKATSIKYVIGDLTFAYNTESNLKTTTTNDDIRRNAASVSYEIAPGLTANITTSSTKEDEGVNEDTDNVTVFALNATF